MKKISTKEVMALVNNELYSEDIKNIANEMKDTL